jgi:AbrB family looped-hinge helix DNA binding protein
MEVNMTPQTARLDRSGRISLPKPVRDFLRLKPGSQVIIEMRGKEVMLRAEEGVTSITNRIAALALPVSDWEQMEREIEAGRLE